MMIFLMEKAHAPQSSELRTWENLITVRSRERPRDTIQLISALAKEALSKRKEKIDQKVFIDVMPIFQKIFQINLGKRQQLNVLKP